MRSDTLAIRDRLLAVQHDYDETEIRRLCDPRADTARQPKIRHLVLSDTRPLRRPIPATGALGLWTPGPDLVAAIHTQLGEAG